MNGNLKPFERAVPIVPELQSYLAAAESVGLPRASALREYEKLRQDEIWKNDEYQVAIDRDPPHAFEETTLWHLSIKRLDKDSLHDWRDLQAIKNQLVGPQYEAVELYPATSRTVDGANQYHLWVFMAIDGKMAPTLPLGFFGHRVVTETPFLKSRQRPLHDKGETL